MNSPRYAPAGLLIEQSQVRVAIDGGPGADPAGPLGKRILFPTLAGRSGSHFKHTTLLPLRGSLRYHSVTVGCSFGCSKLAVLFLRLGWKQPIRIPLGLHGRRFLLNSKRPRRSARPRTGQGAC